MKNIKTIAFDADDTLWVNEPLFRVAEEEFCELLANYLDTETCAKELYAFEMKNLPMYGYGIKPFTLSLVEAAITLSEGKISNDTLLKVIEIGKTMLNAPVVLIDGIGDVLDTLSRKRFQNQSSTRNYKLVVATKGDLLDQERKLEKSGLAHYFHHIEVMSDKQPANYSKLINHLNVSPSDFLMVGNSVKSDVLPVLEVGGWAAHIPFHTTWEHEVVREPVVHERHFVFKEVKELLDIL